MNRWQRVWRDGFAPQLSTAGLRALARALACDDARLIQGATCFPPPLGERLVGCACAIGFCGWQGDGVTRVDQLDVYFAGICDAADARLNEIAACRYFLNWFDETPRAQMRRELLDEVRLTLAARLRNAA